MTLDSMEKSVIARTDDMKDLAKVRELIERIKVGMLTTIDREAGLRSRPLQSLQVDDEACIWFFTAGSSPKVDEIRHEAGQVCISYADPTKQDYFSITGTARIVRDKAKMRELWTPWVKVWFPQGLDDPDLVLLGVEIESAEYWDSPGSKVARLYGMAKALATGDKDAIGENRKVDVKG
jgi:general stress protein 26